MMYTLFQGELALPERVVDSLTIHNKYYLSIYTWLYLARFTRRGKEELCAER